MASVNAKIAFSIAATLAGTPGDFGDASAPLADSRSFSFKPGTGANQANNIFADKRTLAASGTENLDLSGLLQNQLNETIAFTKVRALIITADATNVNDVVVGGHATAAFASMFSDPTDKVKVKPGGMLVLVAPDVNGYAVTATTADLLTIANSNSGTAVGYGIIVVGS